MRKDVMLLLGMLALTALACGRGGDDAGASTGDTAASERQAAPAAGVPQGREVDRRIFAEKMELARVERLDTLPIGAIVVRLGQSFLGTKYTPGTLEAEGPEQLVINLEELDCVTYIENVLALARIVRARTPTWEAFVGELVRIRYRGGELNGYQSRLHYFSEWIDDNERLGLMRNVTRDLGGLPLGERLDFMTTHADAYRQLADSAMVLEIRKIEARLAGVARWYVPESALAAVMPRLENGDLIAATSSIQGLDVAHTGIAVRRGDDVYLMHAPLVGADVQMSESPIDERIRRIEGQDGIMIARPI